MISVIATSALPLATPLKVDIHAVAGRDRDERAKTRHGRISM